MHQLVSQLTHEKKPLVRWRLNQTYKMHPWLCFLISVGAMFVNVFFTCSIKDIFPLIVQPCQWGLEYTNWILCKQGKTSYQKGYSVYETKWHVNTNKRQEYLNGWQKGNLSSSSKTSFPPKMNNLQINSMFTFDLNCINKKSITCLKATCYFHNWKDVTQRK